jgi:hypothetical protein
MRACPSRTKAADNRGCIRRGLELLRQGELSKTRLKVFAPLEAARRIVFNRECTFGFSKMSAPFLRANTRAEKFYQHLRAAVELRIFAAAALRWPSWLSRR